MGLVGAWAYPFHLNEGMYLAMHKLARLVNGDSHHRGVCGDSRQTHTIGRTEVAKAVVDEVAFIDFDAADYMRTMTIDHISTVVDAEVSHLTQ